MSYEEAKQKALKINPKLDTMKEYEDAYIFYNSKAKGTEAQDNEVVVFKSGKVTNYSNWLDISTSNEDKPIRTVYEPKGL